MNRIIKSVAIGVALGCAVLWCCPQGVVAQVAKSRTFTHGEFTQTLAVASGGGIGSDELSAGAIKTAAAAVPFGMPFAVYVSSHTSAAVDADSFHVFVQTRPSGAGNYPTSARSWMNVARLAQSLDSTDYPLLFYVTGMDGWADTVINTAIQPAAQVMYRPGFSLGEVRLLICGSDADTLADGANSWPVHIVW